MGPFCPEQGTSSHAILKNLASTDKKTMFSGEEVGSEKEKSEWNYKIDQGWDSAEILKSIITNFKSIDN